MPGIEDLPGLISRLEKVAIRLETATKAQTFSAQDNAESLAAAVVAFDAIVEGPLKVFLEKCSTIGGDVKTMASKVKEAFSAQRNFLLIVSKASQPSDADLQTLLKDTARGIDEIQSYREQNRRSEYFNHLSGISESISALGWVAVAPAPAPYILEMNNAGQFYTNRVLKDWKEKSRVHVEWVKAWVETLTELQQFVRENHTTGLVWNKNGGDAMALSKSDLSVPASVPAPPPPPPGPPAPPPPPPPQAPTPASQPDPRVGLMESINRGEDLAKGLRKVTDDQKTHKNPELRTKSFVPAEAGKKMEIASTKPPVLELDGKKWVIENINGRPDVVVETTGSNQSVYIYKCNGSTFQIKGKCNNIIMDSCKKSAVVYESVVSSCEFINCQSVQMQVTGSVPTITVDKTDGCQMFLSLESLGTQLVTAKSSEMNLVVPNGDDFVEHPVPEQFKTTFKDGKITTCPTELHFDFDL